MKKEKMIKWGVVLLLIIFFLSIPTTTYGKKKEAVIKMISERQYNLFIKRMEKDGFSKEELDGILGAERLYFDRSILFPEKREPVSYFSEKLGIFKPESIARGKRVLKKKAELFEQAEQAYGVEKELLVAIFRIETNLGSYIGERSVLNTLYTIFMFNLRKKAGEDELRNFLVLCKRYNIKYWSVKGSTAGAFGLWQFMPSSFLDYAYDGNGDEKVDLFCFEDALFSAARYLKGKGWQKGKSINEPASKRHILFRYNRSVPYGRAILAYAKAIK